MAQLLQDGNVQLSHAREGDDRRLSVFAYGEGSQVGGRGMQVGWLSQDWAKVAGSGRLRDRTKER